MGPPVIGLWQVEIELDGHLTHVTHAYHPDGFMHLDAGGRGACLLWEARGDRAFRFRGTRPIEPAIHRFLGWQYAAGEGEVSAHGDTFTGFEETDGPRTDGSREKRRATLRASRLTLE